MSKRALRRALIGGALGALQGAQTFFQTQAAQEAERVREQRLAAIRAEERGQDRAFQSQQTERTITAQAERDKLLFGQQEQRDREQNAQRMREIAKAGETQLAVAGAYRPPERDETIILRTPEGGVMSMSLGDPRLRGGLPAGWQILEGRSGARFGTQPVPDPTNQPQTPSQPTNARTVVGAGMSSGPVPVEGAMCWLPDGRGGRIKGGECVPL